MVIMDVTQALKDAENALRDFIESILSKHHGSDWVRKCGVSEDRINKWIERKQEESRSLASGALSESLIYYADFYDIKTILDKNWSGEIKAALGEKRDFIVFLDQLADFRNPEAHRRELLPHQKSLVIGIAGEIRTRLVKFRSSQENSSDSYYPCFENVRDNYGNIWTPARGVDCAKTVLRPNDLLEFVLTGSDPFGEEVVFTGTCYAGAGLTQTGSNTFSIRLTDAHVRDQFDIEFFIASKRNYHREGSFDGRARFSYKVLPPRRLPVP